MKITGRMRSAPEHFLDPREIAEVQVGRRDFLRGTLAAAAALVGREALAEASPPKAEGDSAILDLPEHTRNLGQPVAARPYGLPSQYEKNVQRRESPGLTRMGAS